MTLTNSDSILNLFFKEDEKMELDKKTFEVLKKNIEIEKEQNEKMIRIYTIEVADYGSKLRQYLNKSAELQDQLNELGALLTELEED